MLKKQTLIIAMLTLLAIPAFSQLRFGVKGGVSTTDLNAQDINVLDRGGLDDLRIAFEEAKYGIHGGIVIRAQFNKFLIQPEVIFNSNTVEYEITEGNQVPEILEEKFQYLDIPLMLGFKFGPLRLMGGPEGRVFINNASDLTRFQDYGETFKDLEFSWLAGVGLDIWNLMIDVRYEGSFNEFGDHIRFGDQQFNFSDEPNRWVFSVGLLFGGK